MIAEPTTTDRLCSYMLTPHGIHELTLFDTSRAGVDVMFDHMAHITETHVGSNTTARMMLNLTHGMGPMPYVMRKIRENDGKYANRPEVRMACVMKDSIQTHLLDSFMRLLRMPKLRMRYFGMTHREQAVKWLLEEPRPIEA
jgi:hypothetical protein